MFSLLRLNRCNQGKIVTSKKILTNFVEGSIIDVWRCSECASESNSIKSYKIIAAEANLKNEIFKA